MDKIMLGIITTNSEVGLYEAAERVIAVPTAFITSLGTIMLPRISNLIANDKKSKSIELLHSSIVFAMFVSSSLAFGLMGIANEFVPIFFGEGFKKCIFLFWILLPSSVFMAFANVVRTQYLLPNGNDKAYVMSAIIGAIVNIIINLILIPYVGAIGAAIGTLISEAIVCIYQCNSVKKELPFKQYIIDAIPFVLSGLCMFLVLNFIQIGTEYVIVMLIKVIIGIIIYFVGVIVIMFFVHKELLVSICKKILLITNR